MVKFFKKVKKYKDFWDRSLKEVFLISFISLPYKNTR